MLRTNKEVSVVEEGTALLVTCGLTATGYQGPDRQVG